MNHDILRQRWEQHKRDGGTLSFEAFKTSAPRRRRRRQRLRERQAEREMSMMIVTREVNHGSN